VVQLLIQSGKIVLKQFYLLCFVLLIAGCNSTTEESNSSPENLSTSAEIGYSFGMFHKSSIDEHQTYYEINSSDNLFVPEIMIDNQINKPYTYRIFALKNYTQQSIGFESQKQNYIDINLQPFEKKVFNISLDVDKGSNDIVIVCIRDPQRTLTEDEYIPPEGVYALRRAVVVNQSTSFNVMTDNLFKSIPVYEKFTNKDNGSIFAPHVLLDGDTELRSVIPNTYTGRLNLRMGVAEPKTRYAFFSIVGDKTIETKYPFIQVDEPGNVDVNLMDLPLKKEKSNKNLIIGVVENPFILDSEQIAFSDNRFTNVITLK